MSSTASTSITAILPARNEEHAIEAAVRSLAAQPPIAEIRVVNDSSSDRTAEILSRLSVQIPRLRIIDAGPLPSGWVGKNHAAWLGAQCAASDWMLFTDADVRHLPDSAAYALRIAAENDAALVSFSPRQRMETWWERALIPFVFVRLAARFPYEAVNDPASRIAAANGQYLLIRRDAYESIGGHRAVAADVLEDVALARLVKSARLPLVFAPGAAVAETRMYTSLRAMWQGWTKNLYPLAGATPLAAAGELLRVAPIEEFALFAFGFFFPYAWPFAAVLLAARLYNYSRRLAEYRFPASCIVYWAPGLALYSAALLASAWRHSQGTVIWKGRTYPVGS